METTRGDFLTGRARSRRWFLGVTALGATGVLLTACTAPASPAPAPSQAAQPTQTGAKPTAGPATPAAASKPAALSGSLRLHIRSGPYQEAWQEVGKLFNQTYPDVEVKLEPVPSAELSQKLQTMAAGGTIGDIYWTNVFTQEYQRFAVNGLAKALDDYAQRDNLDWSQWYATAVDALRVDGKLYGMLDGGHPGGCGIYYNKEMFGEAGLPEPDESWTLDKVVEAATKLAGADKYAFDSEYQTVARSQIFMRAFGGDAYTPDGQKATFTSKESTQGLTWVYDAINTHKFMPKPAGQDPYYYAALFGANKLAMFNGGTYTAYLIIGTKKPWGLAPLPKGPGGRASMAEVNIDCVTTQSKNPDAAWELVKLLAGRESGIFHVDHGVTPGARPDVYDDPKTQEKYPWLKAWASIFKDAQAYVGPANLRGNEIGDLFAQGLDPFWRGEATPDSGIIERVNDDVQKILDQPRP